MQPIHIMSSSVTNQSDSRSMHVHYALSLRSAKTLCGRAKLHKADPIDGDVLRYYETKRPVNCDGCIKSFTMVLRIELDKLNGEQLEILSDVIQNMRKASNGHAEAVV